MSAACRLGPVRSGFVRAVLGLLAIVLAGLGARRASATTYSWTGLAGSGNWSATNGFFTNWSPNSIPPSTADVDFTTITPVSTINLQSARTVNSVTFGGLQAYTFTGGSLAVTSGNETVNSTSAPVTYTIDTPTTLGAPGTFSIASSGLLKFTQALSDGANSYGLAVTGGGTLALQSANNSFFTLASDSGSFIDINGGTVNVRDTDGSIYDTSFAGPVTIENGGAFTGSLNNLQINGGATSTLSVSGATSSITNLNLLTLGNSGTPGNIHVSNGATINNVSFLTVGGIDTGGQTCAGTIDSGSSVSVGSGAIGAVANSVGSVTVKDANSVWQTGVLRLGGFSDSQTGGTGTLTVSGGGKVQSTGDTKFYNTASSMIIDKGFFTTAQLETAAGATPTIQITDGTGTALTLNNTNLGFTPNFAGAIVDSPDGPGSVLKSGGAGQILSGHNTYTGGTTIQGGTLILGATDTLPTTGAIKLSGGTLDLAGNVQHAGTVTLSSGTISMSTPGILLPSSFAIQSGTVSAQTMTSGAVNKTTSGTVAVSAPLSAGTITVSAGTLSLGQGATASTTSVNGGTLQLAGTLQSDLNGAGAVSLSDAATIKGVATFSGSLAVGSFSLVSDSTHTLNTGSLTIAGGTVLSKVGVTVSGAASGYGTVTAEVTGSSGASWTASGGTLTLGDAGDLNGFTGFNGTLAAGTNHLNLLSAGVANLGSSNTVAGGTIASLNGLQLGAGTTLTGNGTVSGAFKNLGSVTGGSGADVLKFTGAVSGTGGFAGNIEFDGSYSPGNSPAAVTLTGNTTLGSLAQLNMEIGGETLGIQCDHVSVGGTLSLGGVLNVSLINSFQPAAGDSFDLLDWGTLSGQFSGVQLPSLPSPLAWDTTNLYANGTLSVVPEPGSLALFGVGLMILARGTSRRRRSN